MNNDLIQTNLPGFSKNKKTGAIINTDLGEFNRIVAVRKKAKQLEQLINDLAGVKESLKRINKKLGIE